MMLLGKTITNHRKKLNITQEVLASQLRVSSQAVSKWELDQCYPDLSLLPQLADIFHISVDELLGRDSVKNDGLKIGELPWEDDGALRVVVYRGHKLVEHEKDARKIEFAYSGEALNIYSELAVKCKDVKGNVTAKEGVNCGNIGGNVSAEEGVNCGNIGGNVSAEEDVNCGNVRGNVTAKNSVQCGKVEGNVTALERVECGDVQGDVTAGDGVVCKSVGGNVTAGKVVNMVK